jgi:predicted amidohydrolase YtcJ
MIDLLLRQVEVEGRGRIDVAIDRGLIVALGAGARQPAKVELEGRGCALLPGLWDHHIHLFAFAAALESVAAGPPDLTDLTGLARALRRADANLPRDKWLRAVGYHDSVAGPLDRTRLDAWVPDRPMRLQYRTGSLWVLNSAAITSLGDGAVPPGADLETGRIFREDAWLRSRLPSTPPDLAPVARRLDAAGIVGITDASVTTDQAAAERIAAASRKARMRQHLFLMSGGALGPGRGFAAGPVKLLIDDAHLPDPAAMAQTIAAAHAAGRAAAVHCVTAGELAITLAAFEEAGAHPGDRIEHGGIVDPEAAGAVARLGLTIVTQPSFIAERGDRYRVEVDSGDLPHLYPCASLIARGISVAGSSDAPYGSADPWAGMRAAVNRQSRNGHVLGTAERVTPRRALGLWLGAPGDPGGPERKVEVGTKADLCLMYAPLGDILETLASDLVRTTIIGGEIVFPAA